jgi:septum formation protein
MSFPRKLESIFMTNNCKNQIILASASPRRQELLAEAGYKFKVVVSNVDESVFPTEGITSAEYSKQLALAKANDVAEKYPDSIVIGADTVVDFEGQIIGKPDDAEHAEEITRKLFSKPHKVITGLAIIRRNRSSCTADNNSRCHSERAQRVEESAYFNGFLRSVPKNRDSGRNDSKNDLQIVEADTTIVYPRKLTDAQIADHIKSGIWQDKAGAYSIRDNDPFVDHIDGSLTNVMGMPMELFKRLYP